MQYTQRLVQSLQDENRNRSRNNAPSASFGWDDAVLKYNVPTIVSHVYREHVEGWFAFSKMTPSQKSLWYAGLAWLRGLERRCNPRLFFEQTRVDPKWWDAHLRTIVSRRPTTARVTLPLEGEIDVCLQALSPHFMAWILGLVPDKKLELGMFPKTLLQRTYVEIRRGGDKVFTDLARKVRALYPDIVKPITKQAFDEAYYPYPLSHWPGLRLTPPFFPDLAAFFPPPSTSMPSRGRYMVVHAYLHESYAKASIYNAHVAALDDLRIDKHTFPLPLGLRITSENAATVLDTLRTLDGIHPRSFRCNHPQSPFVKAASLLAPFVGFCDEAVRIPENALENCEIGFSFTYMKPRVYTGNDDRNMEVGGSSWDKEEEFFEVNAVVDGAEHTFHISSYVGFGLRLRHTITATTDLDALCGQGVCVVVPDGLDQETTENIMLTCIGFLRDLGLRDLKLLSEGVCHAMCLGSVSAVSQRPAPSSWASFHDGPLTCQALGVLVKDEHKLKDMWGGKYRVQPLKDRLVAKMRDYILGHNEVKGAIDRLVNNRFAGRAAIIESIKKHLPQIIDTLEKNFAEHDTTTFTLTFSNIDPLTIDFAKPLFEEWMVHCFEEMTQQPWWEELKNRLEKCSGVLVSGGLFQCCPRSALCAFRNILTPETSKHTKENRLNMLHGACLAIYGEKRCRTLMLSAEDNVSLPILKIE